MTTSAETTELTQGNAACKHCGSTERSRKSANHCKCGKMLPGNRAAAIVGQHGADFRREHQAEIDAKADQFARDAGYHSVQAAPLGFQIAAIALARTATIGDLAYWKMLEAGGPLSESGKPRRAYSIWADTNRDLARDLKGAMTEVVAARPPGAVGDNPYQERSTADLIAFAESLLYELRELRAQDRRSDRRAALPDGHAQPVPPPCHTRNNFGPALSRNSASSPTASKAAAAVRTGEPRLTPTPDSDSPTAEPSPAPRSVPATSGSGFRERVSIHDDPYERFRNV